MKKIITTLAVVSLAVPAIVLAAPAPKVWVCKMVGTPGVDERLQTGQNPIDVSENAIKNFQGVGSYFNDAQGRSYVLAVDNGQPGPDVSQCPAGQTPPPAPTPTPTPPPSPTPSPTPVTPPTVTPPATQTTNQSSSSTTANDTPDMSTFVGK